MPAIAYNVNYPRRGGLALFAALADRLNHSTGPLLVRLAGLPLHIAAYLSFAPQNGLRHYLKMQYADQTFKGLYHWNWFDAALLLPYFAVMIVLAHLRRPPLYALLPLFQVPQELRPQSAMAILNELPLVTVQLPIFNEQFVIDRLIEAVCAMEYPREKLEIQVLDDSTDETTEVAAGNR